MMYSSPLMAMPGVPMPRSATKEILVFVFAVLLLLVGAGVAAPFLVEHFRDSDSAETSPPAQGSSTGTGGSTGGDSMLIPTYALTSTPFSLGWTSTWLSTLSRVNNQLVRIGVVGDDVGAGNCASNVSPVSNGTGFVQLLASMFNTRFGDGGSGFQSPVANSQYPAYAAYNASNLPVSYDSFQLSQYADGTTSAVLYATSTSGASMTFQVRGRFVVVHHMIGPNYDPFTVSIDGVIVSTINPNYPNTSQSKDTYSVGVGDHTVVLTSMAESGNQVGIVGVSGEGGFFYGIGVVVDNMSVPGMQLTLFEGTHSNGNATDNTGANPAADLLIVELGLNDELVATPADFISAYRRMLTRYQQIGVTLFLLLMPNAGNRNTSTFQSYRTQAAGLAADFGAALIDLNTVEVGDYDSLCNQGFYAYASAPGTSACAVPGRASTDVSTCSAFSPSDKGHYNIARLLFSYLSPG